MNPNFPTWLTSTNETHGPFRRATRQHLLARAERDPRIVELVARLQEKGEEGSREREWAQRVCREGQKMMTDLHAKFAPSDEEDILRLAAYMGDHTYAHFFVEYNNTPPEKKGEFAEMIERISPIIADVQPSVAIGFAPDIMEVYTAAGKKAEAEQLFLDIAKQHPQAVMGNTYRLEAFDNYSELTRVAQEGVEAQALLSPEKARFAERMRAQQAVAKQRGGLA